MVLRRTSNRSFSLWKSVIRLCWYELLRRKYPSRKDCLAVRLQVEVEQLTKDAQAYVADLHEAEQTEEALRAEIEQATQRATEVESEAAAAVEQAERQAAEMRGRDEQLQAENNRLTKLIDEQLAKLTNDTK